MAHQILTDTIASITELKKHPLRTVKEAHDKPLAILSRNEPVFYCISAKTYEAMVDILEDVELAKIVQARLNEKEIEVNIDDL